MEVRRCPRCKESSAVCVREWQVSVNMLPAAPGNREFRCQACGAAFLIRPRGAALGLFIMAGIFAPVALLGIVGGALDIAEKRTLEAVVMWVIAIPFIASFSVLPFLIGRHFRGNATPVIPNAPVPPMRFRGLPEEERPRRCTCGRTATCMKVTANRVNGIPTGIEHEFSCACGKRFIVASTWGTIISTLGVALCFAIGGGLLWASTPDTRDPHIGWAALVFGSLFALAGAVVGAQTVKRVLTRIKYPPIAAPQS